MTPKLKKSSARLEQTLPMSQSRLIDYFHSNWRRKIVIFASSRSIENLPSAYGIKMSCIKLYYCRAWRPLCLSLCNYQYFNYRIMCSLTVCSWFWNRTNSITRWQCRDDLWISILYGSLFHLHIWNRLGLHLSNSKTLVHINELSIHRYPRKIKHLKVEPWTWNSLRYAVDF